MAAQLWVYPREKLFFFFFACVNTRVRRWPDYTLLHPAVLKKLVDFSLSYCWVENAAPSLCVADTVPTAGSSLFVAAARSCNSAAAEVFQNGQLYMNNARHRNTKCTLDDWKTCLISFF